MSYSETADMVINYIHYIELPTVGAFCLSRTTFDKTSECITPKSIKLEVLITDEFPLSDVDQSFKVAESGDAIKVLKSTN